MSKQRFDKDSIKLRQTLKYAEQSLIGTELEDDKEHWKHSEISFLQKLCV